MVENRHAVLGCRLDMGRPPAIFKARESAVGVLDSVERAGTCSDQVIQRASGDVPAEYSFVGSQLLICAGFVVDTIAGLGATGVKYWDWDIDAVVSCPEWRSAYGGSEETSKALCNTLMLGRMGGNKAPEPRHGVMLSLPKRFELAMPQFQQREWTWMASQECYYFRWELWREAHDDMRLGDMRLGDYFSDEMSPDATERDYAEVYGAFDRTCKERRFMPTTNGCIGWAPDNIVGALSAQARKGDLICIIFGCSTPLVVRHSARGQYQVVGEAYVEGIMDGQALGLLESNARQVQEFTFS